LNINVADTSPDEYGILDSIDIGKNQMKTGAIDATRDPEDVQSGPQTISILYVDDDRALLEITKLFLEGTGEYHVDTAESVHRALDILQHRIYDAIISDYQMPELNGIDFLRILRIKYPKLPFILFTGKDRDEIAIATFENGADYYHQKGGNPEVQYAELSHKIRKSVAHYQTELAMRKSGHLLRQQIQNTSDFLRIFDTDGRVIHDAPSTSTLLGYPENFFIGKNVDPFIHPEDLMPAITAFDQVRDGGKSGVPFGFRVKKADGMYIDVESIAMNLLGVRGVDGIVITTWPAPERKSTGHELRINQKNIRDVSNNDSKGIYRKRGGQIVLSQFQ
jgi:PAS domain S-box-containing protein